MSAIARQVMDADSDRTMRYRFQDLPGNDWDTLMATIATTELLGNPDTDVHVVKGSFYESVLPENSVDLGMSFMAAHWMSRQLDVSVHQSAAVLDAGGDDLLAAEDLAAADWLNFWKARATELKPGGALLVRCIGSEEDPERSTSMGILRRLGEGIQSAADAGLLSTREADHFVLSEYPRTVREARAPFRRGDLADLKLVSASLQYEGNLVSSAYGNVVDRKASAERLTSFVRAFTEQSLRSYLETTRKSDDVARIVEHVYSYCQHLWSDDLLVDQFHAWTLTTLVRKVAK